ncbi:helix-turn-helix domain-containing protein [Bradyrhizobium brasilense]|uniref:helix-turn-helix domain-containing protein n=1 Tax=Bradyrhizobium brasilense TaxID=1419277 RepID=UPI002877673E|nr:helix-turn-helix domain-containing protein [Bradyrhizobium brasilense]MCP3418597.1 helix-turn-helix domain-containing protein [Bradyrhizobium brasilense]
MSDAKFLTPEEVSGRYRGEVTVGTLRNWRAMRIGPAYVKIGKAVLYPVDELDAWDRKKLVICSASKGLNAN